MPGFGLCAVHFQHQQQSADVGSPMACVLAACPLFGTVTPVVGHPGRCRGCGQPFSPQAVAAHASKMGPLPMVTATLDMPMQNGAGSVGPPPGLGSPQHSEATGLSQ